MGGAQCCSCKSAPRASDAQSARLQNFQNYSKSVEQLDKFDSFYRVVCYPMHCLQAKELFTELDELSRVYENEVKNPRNS